MASAAGVPLPRAACSCCPLRRCQMRRFGLHAGLAGAWRQLRAGGPPDQSRPSRHAWGPDGVAGTLEITYGTSQVIVMWRWDSGVCVKRQAGARLRAAVRVAAHQPLRPPCTACPVAPCSAEAPLPCRCTTLHRDCPRRYSTLGLGTVLQLQSQGRKQGRSCPPSNYSMRCLAACAALHAALCAGQSRSAQSAEQ